MSARNPRVAQLRRLVRRRRDREAAGRFVLEGAMLLEEACAAGVVPHEIYTTADSDPLSAAVVSAMGFGDTDYFSLDGSVLASIASTESPQPLLSVVDTIAVALDDALAPDPHGSGAPLIVVAAGVSEPGNLGTIVRSAAAAGATAVVTTEGCADLYNPKAVRATAGALFRVPVARDVDPDELWQALGTAQMTIVGLAGESSTRYDQVDLTVPVAVVAGNEAHGLAPELRQHLDTQISIPMAADVESLNVATALTVVAFEAARQRRNA